MVRAFAIVSVLISSGLSVIVMGVSCSVVPCGVRRVIWSLPWVGWVSRLSGVVIFRVVPAWVMFSSLSLLFLFWVLFLGLQVALAAFTVQFQGWPFTVSWAAVRVQPLLHTLVRSSLYWL